MSQPENGIRMDVAGEDQLPIDTPNPMENPVDWFDSETGEGWEAELGGYVAWVHPDTWAKASSGFCWSVMATSAVSEWPELQDAGSTSDEQTAKAAAVESMRKAANRRSR